MQMRVYESEKAPAPIIVEMNDAKSATAVIVVNSCEPIEGSEAYLVEESLDASPVRAEYGALVEAIIALKYTIGSEIALNRLDDSDPEKQAYLAFVAEAKKVAKAALGV